MTTRLTARLSGQMADLAPYVDAGVFDVADIRFVDALIDIYGPLDLEEMLAAALAVRAPTHRHVCVDLADLDTQFSVESPDAGALLWWPSPGPWADRLASSVLMNGHPERGPAPLRLVGGRLYLHRLERQEDHIAGVIADRVEASSIEPGRPDPSPATLALADSLFGPAGDGDDLQRQAALAGLRRKFLVLAGGPGTGKTRTIAGLLMMLATESRFSGRPLSAAIAAPTGKAAARLNEAIRSRLADVDHPDNAHDPLGAVSASTLHRLLGARHDRTWRHDSAHPLPHDVVIVDEVSMVALPLMARLFEALAPDTTLILVGDPFQLASVEAGTVLADIIGPARDEPEVAREANPALADSIVVLRSSHRFDPSSMVGSAAAAILARDPAAAAVALTERPALDAAIATAIDHAVAVGEAARSGDAAAALDQVGRFGFLCASWRGAGGVDAVNAAVTDGVAQRLSDPDVRRPASPGSLVMVTGNHPGIQLYNGDVGVVCMVDERVVVAFDGPDGPRLLPPHLVGETIAAWAITVHRSQGSEYNHVIVSLPNAPSPLLTRELLYTAVTRARTRVEVVGDDAALAEAVRRDIRRASGLRERLWG